MQKFYNGFKQRKSKEKLKLFQRVGKNYLLITKTFEKACDETSVFQDSSAANTTTAVYAQIADVNDSNNSTTSTEQNQQQKKDTEEDPEIET